MEGIVSGITCPKVSLSLKTSELLLHHFLRFTKLFVQTCPVQIYLVKDYRDIYFHYLFFVNSNNLLTFVGAKGIASFEQNLVSTDLNLR
jgi:hypothetical protein